MKKTVGQAVVYRLGVEPVSGFAAAELARYLARMSGRPWSVRRARRYEPATPGLWVGLASDFGEGPTAAADSGEVVFVEAGGGHGILSGSVPRAVLFAVYRYLEELGCRWFRPGPDGERVPRVADPLAHGVALLEVPDAAQRCVCIEGACSREHVLAVLDYAAKRGFNAYQTQFRNAFTFFERWYGLEKNRAPVRTPFSSARALALQEQVKRAALRRGLMLHTVGHGWTCEPFGVKGEAWEAGPGRAPAAMRPFLAELKGVRELFGGIALNTQLCLSNEAGRRKVVAAVADYARLHPREAVVHVWLADGSNNYCECTVCRAAPPSDFYVQLLNELDARLTAAGLPTRIVFAAYVDLLWAPAREKIRNPARFFLMFAPITRLYSESFAAGLADADRLRPAPYRRNKLTFPTAPAANLALLKRWRRAFGGERLIFEYYLWRAHHYDPGYMKLARVMHADLSALKEMGFDGLISCQCQRVAFPTGFLWEVLGRTLWDRRTDYERMASRYFRELFGPAGGRARRFLETISGLTALDMPLLAATVPPDARAGAIRRWRRVPARADAFAAVCRAEGGKAADRIARTAWRHLELFCAYVRDWALFQAQAWSRNPAASATYSRMADDMDRRLPDLHPVFDTHMSKGLLQHTLWVNKLPFEERVAVKRGAVKRGAPARRTGRPRG